MTSSRSPYLRFGLLIAAFAFLFDQVTKWVIITPLSLEAKRVIEIVDIFNLTWAENCGISLSMFASCTDTTRWTLVAVTALVAGAVGIWMKIDLSLPPYSSTRTVVLPSSDRRFAITQPAEPAPMMM